MLFPPPWQVFLKAIELARDGTLWEQASASLGRIASGFAGGSLLGIPIGLAIGSFPIVRRLLEPYTEFLRFIPATAMITVAVIWFGIGEGSKIFLIVYTTIFIVIINTAAGVSAVAPNKIRAARSLGASRAQVFFFVAFPATVPYILTGMRLAMANSFVTIIAAELVAANNGLGRMIWDSRMYMLVDQIFVALLVLGAAGLHGRPPVPLGHLYVRRTIFAGDLTWGDIDEGHFSLPPRCWSQAPPAPTPNSRR